MIAALKQNCVEFEMRAYITVLYSKSAGDGVDCIH